MSYYRRQFLLAAMAGWVNRHQQDVIAYLVEENRAYAAHYHLERNHQGRGNRPLEPGPEVARRGDMIECRQRPVGLLRYYTIGGTAAESWITTGMGWRPRRPKVGR